MRSLISGVGAFSLFVLVLLTCEVMGGTVFLGDLDLGEVRQGWGKPQGDRSVTEKVLSIGGVQYGRGLGTHAASVVWVELDGRVVRFRAKVGVDDATTSDASSIEFQVGVDGRRVWRSGVMRRGDEAKEVDVDLSGARQLLLLVTDAGDGVSFDHADWAEAALVFEGKAPVVVRGPEEERVLLTPSAPLEPRIHGPAVYGARAGNPLLYRIPTTGERPIQFSVDGLPSSLRLDAANGILSGTAPEDGAYRLVLRAENGHGSVSRELRLEVGAGLALTPPMGWNHWYAHYDRITDAMMRRAADIMVEKGMADVGYSYVSIDDCWMNAPENKDPKRVGPLRDERGDILSNRHFPDMRGLTEHIHGYGLKAGIYTSPGPLTCAGFSGSYGHEAADAARFADWGFDLLKYDWCSYGNVSGVDQSRESLKKPYILMGELLKQQHRDIVLNLCQYGMGEVWEWGAEVGGHSWRTSGDLGFELGRIFEVALANAGHREFNRPGAWNDPDYIQIGNIGSAFGMGEPRPCPLSPGEQYAFMSLWSLMACPLFYSGDLESLDPFTLNVLCNPEVIAINQDELGECARPVVVDPEVFCMVKRMVDGSVALGVFNSGEFDAEVAVDFADLGIGGARRVRDVWRQQDVALGARSYAGKVGRRSGVLLRLSGSGER
ncbi:MAG: hypothetical protein RI897_1301 [Verrucomicrobiota bacterium]|jgi:alpha-galactosidase